MGLTGMGLVANFHFVEAVSIFPLKSNKRVRLICTLHSEVSRDFTLRSVSASPE